MRGLFLPLAIYLGVTLGIPFLNGAGARLEFWKHAAAVAAIAVSLVAMRLAIRAARALCQRGISRLGTVSNTPAVPRPSLHTRT